MILKKKITRNNFLIKSLYKLNPFEQNYQPLIKEPVSRHAKIYKIIYKKTAETLQSLLV